MEMRKKDEEKTRGILKARERERETHTLDVLGNERFFDISNAIDDLGSVIPNRDSIFVRASVNGRRNIIFLACARARGSGTRDVHAGINSDNGPSRNSPACAHKQSIIDRKSGLALRIALRARCIRAARAFQRSDRARVDT